MNATTGKFRRSSRRGFTLIEVLVTLVLMGIVLPVAMRGISTAIAAASYARHAAEAANLGESKLSEIVANWNMQTDTVPTSGDFGVAWPDYTFEATQTDDADLMLTTITLTVKWNEHGQPRVLNLSTMVQDPVATTT